mgnify:CR=1 FL=1
MSRNYKIKMTNTYKNIYSDLYNLDKKTLKYTIGMIKKNLKEMHISLRNLKKMNVLNIGTGRESVVFHILGAKKVFHRDISPVAVGTVQKHSKKFNRLETKEINICNDELNLPEKVDLIYLCGVFHHFNKPKFALQNLINNLNYNGVIFIRNYSSGSSFFFIADYIRKFLPQTKTKLIQKLLKDTIQNKFGKFKLDNKFWDLSYKTYLYNATVDNCCVPTLNLFDSNNFQKCFEENNFQNLLKIKYPQYMLNDFDHIGLLMRSYIFKNLNKTTPKMKTNNLKIIDQLNIKYKESYINKTVKLMKKKLSKIKKYSLKEKIDLLIDLKFISNAYRYQKFYSKITVNYYKKNLKKLSNHKGIHELFRSRIG